jgi:[acyl-carrier-protein] S-malonyltransferase
MRPAPIYNCFIRQKEDGDMKIAWLFPGQGSQYIGMGQGLFELSASAKEIFDEAEAISGLPLRELSVNGPAERLRDCDVLEPLLTAISLSYAAFLRQQGVHPSFVAGYSAGEVAALYSAGVVGLRDALKIASLRGKILHQAARSLSGKMLAVYRLGAQVVEEIVADLETQGVIAVAAWNAPDHTTIVGDEGVMAKAQREAVLFGAEVAAVDIAGPWHCRLAEHTAKRIGAALSDIRFSFPRVPIYMSSTGTIGCDPDTIRRCLVEHVYKPVRWSTSLNSMVASGVQHFIEVGPGKMLKGFVKRVIPRHDGCNVIFMEGQNGLPFKSSLTKIAGLRVLRKMQERCTEAC